MRYVLLLGLTLFLVKPSHAQETSHLEFVSEYVRELGVNESMRAAGERDLAQETGNDRLSAIIRSSTRIQLELRS